MVTVTRSNFLEQFRDLRRHLPGAAFVAIDEEMTGISPPGGGGTEHRRTREDTPEERYRRLKVVPERYAIVQVGVALFHENPNLGRRRRRSTGYPPSFRRESDIEDDDRDDDDAESEPAMGAIAGDGEGGEGEGAGPEERRTGDDGDRRPGGGAASDAGATRGGEASAEVGRRTAAVVAVARPGEDAAGDGGGDEEAETADGSGGGAGEGNDDDDDDDVVSNSDTEDDDDDEEEDRRDYAAEEEPEFLVRKYNFYVYPSATSGREFVVDPSATSFLAENDTVDFDVWTKRGIPYVVGREAEALYEQFRRKHDRKDRRREEELRRGGGSKSGSTAWSRFDAAAREGRGGGGGAGEMEGSVVLTRHQDVVFRGRVMADLREWMDAALPARPPSAPTPPDGGGGDAGGDGDDRRERERGRRRGEGRGTLPRGGGRGSSERDEFEGLSYLLPPCNSFLRRAIHERIEMEYPDLTSELSHGDRIKVWRLSPDERRRRDRRRKREEWEDLVTNRVGFYNVFKALSDANRGLLSAHRHYPEEDDDVDDVNDDDSAGWPSSGATNGTEGTTTGGIGNGGGGGTGGSRGGIPPPPPMNEPSVSRRAPPAPYRRRRVPIIVHNGLLDVLFLLTHFDDPELPSSYADAKRRIRRLFPCLYDTKVLATEHAVDRELRDPEGLGVRVAEGGLGGAAASAATATTLENLYDRQCASEGIGMAPVAQIVNYSDDDDDEDDGLAHEASYDAYMTGCVYASLCRDIADYRAGVAAVRGRPTTTTTMEEEDDEERTLFGRNKLYLMSTLYTVDLEAEGFDPLSRGMDPSVAYRVWGPGVGIIGARGVRAALSSLRDYGSDDDNDDVSDDDDDISVEDSDDDDGGGGDDGARGTTTGRRIGLEMVWLDDDAFVVTPRVGALVPRGAGAEAEASAKRKLRRRASLVVDRLRELFRDAGDGVEIRTLEEHWAENGIGPRGRAVAPSESAAAASGDRSSENDGGIVSGGGRLARFMAGVLGAIRSGKRGREPDGAAAAAGGDRKRRRTG